MNCPVCACPCGSGRGCCPLCGTILPLPPALPAPKARRSWIPALILTVVFLLGTMLFFLIPMGDSEVALAEPGSTEALAPSGENQPETTPLFTEDCFTLEDGVLHFDPSKYTEYPVLLVPSAIDGQSVTTIGAGCFEGVSGISTIVLPNSVTAIEDRAFAGCRDLRGLFVPMGVTSIGAEAFYGCTDLESVYLPTALNFVGTDAFENCPMLTYVFYNGFYEEWISLYPQHITPFTWVICWDGESLHGAKTS